MALKVKKKERETSQSLIRRFSKKIRQSGILRQARDSQYKKRSKSKEMKKRAALRREELREEYEKKRKMGEI